MSLMRQVLLDSPAGYWPLNETSGTTAKDCSGNGRDGTYTGSVTLASRKVRSGILAPDFTGGYVSLGDVAAFESEAGSSGLLTLEAWIVVDAVVSNGPTIFTKGASSNYEWAMSAFSSGGTPSFDFVVSDALGNPVMEVTPGYGSTLISQTHHLVCTYDRAAPLVTIYVDGAMFASSTSAAGNAVAGTSEARIGSRVGSGLAVMDGGISDVAIYPTALSATRVKAHYEAGIRGGAVFG